MNDLRAEGGAPGVPGWVERVFAPIEGREWAAALARDLGKAFVVVAVVQSVLAWLRGPGALVDAALYAVAGVVLWRAPSRLAAGLACATAAVSLPLAVRGLFGPAHTAAGRSIVLSLVALWISGRAVAATLACRRFADSPARRP